MRAETLDLSSRLSDVMMNGKSDGLFLPRSSQAETRALWVVLAAGAVLMVTAAAAGEQPRVPGTSSRTDRFQAALKDGATVRIDNVNGDIVATPGKSFSAVVTTTVSAPTQARSDEILAATRIEESRDADPYRLKTVWPFQNGWAASRRHDGYSMHCRECRITTRYEIVLPPGVSASLQTVNGDVRVRDLDGDTELHSVNGNVQVAGSRRSVRAQTVNGRVEASAAALPASAAWDLKTVNGSVVVTLPANARFDWTASTMGGTIASTFAFPAGRGETSAPAAPAAPSPDSRPPSPRRPPKAVVVEDDEGEVVVDTEQLARQIEESMRDVQVLIDDSQASGVKMRRRIEIPMPGRNYSSSVGGGGARVQVSTLNGSITLLAAGTAEADAKPLVEGRRAVVVTVPAVRINAAAPRVVRLPQEPRETPAPEASGEGEEEFEIVRGDVPGDFLSTSNGSYQVGHVAGRVKVLTHSGEIHILSAGNGADVKTYGGDVQIGVVHGDLKAQTLAGDVRAGEITGAASVSTSGGDIRIDRVVGPTSARTAGGDIVLLSAAGPVQAETGGGEVRIGVVSKLARSGVDIHNSGGDIVLTLPSNIQADVDLAVEGIDDPDEVLIHSDFPGIAVARAEDSQRASGTINGGGPRIVVRTTSGSIRLRKGPAAGS